MSVLDRKWREHLYEMDYLQEGIGLRAMAQRDPLVEYQREGFLLFEAMMEGIKEESVGYLFNVEVDVDPGAAATNEASEPMAVGDLVGSLAAPAQDSAPDAEAPSDALADGPQDAPAGRDAPARQSAPVISAKGLQGPSAKRLHYSAPSDDGSVAERDVEPAAATSGSTGSTGSTGKPPKRPSKKARRRGK